MRGSSDVGADIRRGRFIVFKVELGKQSDCMFLRNLGRQICWFALLARCDFLLFFFANIIRGTIGDKRP